MWHNSLEISLALFEILKTILGFSCRDQNSQENRIVLRKEIVRSLKVIQIGNTCVSPNRMKESEHRFSRVKWHARTQCTPRSLRWREAALTALEALLLGVDALQVAAPVLRVPHHQTHVHAA